MKSYQSLADSYDALMADAEHRRRAAFLMRAFRKSKPAVHTVLDLACGTGTIACLLAQAGYQVTATDASEEMLTQAAQKAAALSGQPPLFLCQSMPQLRLLEPVDAAISTLDSLNHLTRERDLRQTFARVYRWLRPGGRFYFDVNTPWKLQRMDGQIRRRRVCAFGGPSSPKRPGCARIRWTCSASGRTEPGTGSLKSTGNGPGAGRSWSGF